MANFFDLFRRGSNSISESSEIIRDLQKITEQEEVGVNSITEMTIDEDNSGSDLLNGMSVQSISEAAVSHHSPESLTRMLDSSDIKTEQILNELKANLSYDEIYRENEEMAKDSVVGSAMEIITDDACQIDEKTKTIVSVESDDEDLRNFLQDFLEFNVNIEDRIWEWTFEIVKHGDFKLRRREYYIGSPDTSVKNVYYENVIQPYKVTRIEYMGRVLGYRDEEFDENKVSFEKPDTFVHFMSSKMSKREKVKLKVKDPIEGHMEEVTCYKVCGTSIVDNARYIFRIVNLLDNMLILSRVARSTQYNLVKVEVGNASAAKTQQILSDVRRRIEGATKLKKNSGLRTDPSPIPVNSNVYIPTRDGKGDVQIESVNESVDVRSITDIDYFRDKEFATLKIPKQYVGFEECFRYDTKVRLLNGSVYEIGYLSEHPELWEGKSIMTCSPSGELTPSKIVHVKKTRENATYVRVHLDNGKYVDVTPDHMMMLRDGTFKEAGKLVSGESLMPFVHEYDGKGRMRVKQNIDPIYNKWEYQYRLVAEKMFNVPKGYHVHHKDKIKCNDDPSNLEVLSIKEHYNRHIEDFAEKGHEANRCREWTEEQKEEVSKRFKGVPKSKAFREHMSEIQKGMQSHNPFKSGDENPMRNPEIVEKQKESLRDYYDNGGTVWQERPENAEKVEKFIDNMLMRLYGHTERSREFTYVCDFCGKEYTKEMQPKAGKELALNPHYCCVNCMSRSRGRAVGLKHCKELYEAGLDVNKENYDKLRKRYEISFDSFMKTPLAKYIPDYNNHKVVMVEHLVDDNGCLIIEDAYDLGVEHDNHTFALDAGIFVHNSLPGTLGNNSLVKLDIRYARSVKRVQTILRYGIEELCNNYLRYRGRISDVGKFSIRMRPLSSADNAERIEEHITSMQVFDAMNSTLETFSPYIDKAKLFKSLLNLTNISPSDIASEEFQTILDELDKGTYKESNHKIEVPEDGGDGGW